MANNLKGSGDYGVFAFGVYNGQGANRVELNNDMHMVARVTYPYQFSNGQIFEAGVEALHGRFVTSNGPVNGITPVMVAPAQGFVDERVAVHAVLYPQPFGLQAEWNWGRGPQLNDPQRLITDSPLNGGYVQATFKYDSGPWGIMFPFVKWQYYEGGQKSERNAPRNLVNDWEFGVEWQVTKAIELTAEYHMMNRTDVLNAPYNQFRADVVRSPGPVELLILSKLLISCSAAICPAERIRVCQTSEPEDCDPPAGSTGGFRMREQLGSPSGQAGKTVVEKTNPFLREIWPSQIISRSLLAR